MKLLFEDLTSSILGAYYNVFGALRNRRGYSEENFARALALELRRRGLAIREQVHVARKYSGTVVGGDFVDIIVAEKIVVQIKKVSRLRPEYLHQVQTYLLDTKLAVGLVLNFGGAQPEFRRVYERTNDPGAIC